MYVIIIKLIADVFHAVRVCKVKKVNMRTWRNWQTRRIQVPVVAILCGFKSHRPHQKEGASAPSFFTME